MSKIFVELNANLRINSDNYKRVWAFFSNLYVTEVSLHLDLLDSWLFLCNLKSTIGTNWTRKQLYSETPLTRTLKQCWFHWKESLNQKTLEGKEQPNSQHSAKLLTHQQIYNKRLSKSTIEACQMIQFIMKTLRVKHICLKKRLYSMFLHYKTNHFQKIIPRCL